MRPDDTWQTYYPGILDSQKIAKLIGPFNYCVKRRCVNGSFEYRLCTEQELADAETKFINEQQRG